MKYFFIIFLYFFSLFSLEAKANDLEVYPNILKLETNDYVTFYHTKLKTPLFVKEVLTPEEFSKNPPRYRSYIYDARVKFNSLKYYKKSGYDKGHLAASANFSNKYSIKTANLSTNLVPQLPSFNRGIWKKLEIKVRNMSKDQTIVVFTGIILDSCKNPKNYLKDKNVIIPQGFYKVVIKQDGSRIIWVLSHKKYLFKNLDKYITSKEELNSKLCFFRY